MCIRDRKNLENMPKLSQSYFEQGDRSVTEFDKDKIKLPSISQIHSSQNSERVEVEELSYSICLGNKNKQENVIEPINAREELDEDDLIPVSYTHLRAHETSLHLVCRLLLEKKKKIQICPRLG
eukprot:TRINITY_DN15930_c0_g1_i1.p2 TRINITY_DN15930_c0_g1~~TRINITY_DN15930_c0_g1_i1.p2  ORF type:complete len:124 (-),score=34.13 TRINITY_DN15930_c0_g1_i1:83-454(-)